MNRRLVMRFFAMALLLAVFWATGITAYAADAPYKGYNYDVRRKAVPAPNGYEPLYTISGTDLKTGAFNDPKDLFVDNEYKELYILDSGNARVIILDSDLKVKNIINYFFFDGKGSNLSNPQGIFVKNRKLFIADTGNNRVLVSDMQGRIEKVITKPESDVFTAAEFKPLKVLADHAENIFVICDSVYQGAVVFDIEGQFNGFYGSNRVSVSLRLLADDFWKKIFTEEQRQQMVRYVPIEYKNFDIDPKGFIFTCSASNPEDGFNYIKKLNFSGRNILKADQAPVGNKFGDFEITWFEGKAIDTSFIDINIDNEGFINGLDMARGRIYQYDQDGNLVLIFGGIGPQKGTFVKPEAIDNLDDKLIVLDSSKNNLTVFGLTEFGSWVHKAFQYYNKGLYDKALEPWKEVLKRDLNYEGAYRGIGNALMNAGKYGESLPYFKLGFDQPGYSKAFKEYRSEYLRDNFWIVAIVMFLVLAFSLLLPSISSRRRVSALNSAGIEKKWQYPLHILLHPGDTFEEMRHNKAESYTVSGVILLAWYIASILKKQYTGFAFNFGRPEELNIVMLFMSTVFLFAVFAAVNWSICTLQDGEGRFRQIWAACSYSLLPHIIVTFAVTLLSNFLVKEEEIFLTCLTWLGQIYSIILMLIGLKVAHQYTGKKTIFSVLFTVIGVLLLLFLAVLLASLMQQLYVFVRTIISEIMFKLR